MAFGNNMFVVSVLHRPWLHIPANAPPPCKCSAGVAAEADHANVCGKVAKMTQMGHDNLANALRLVVSACSCRPAAEPCYRALVGKKGMVEWQCRGDIVGVLPRLELAAVNVVVAHASAMTYADQAAQTGEWTAARAERSKRTRFRKDEPDHAAFRFVSFAGETSGYTHKEAVRFVNHLGDIAAESGRFPNGAIARRAMQLLSMMVQLGNVEMHGGSGLVI